MAMKLKKPSASQREYLLGYMESNLEFALDKFPPHERTERLSQIWQELAIKLNRLGTAQKDAVRWRKYWLDQRIHIKERDALHKAAFKVDGVYGPRYVRPLDDYEKRVINLLTPKAVAYEEEEHLELANNLQQNVVTEELKTFVEEKDNDNFIAIKEEEFLDEDVSIVSPDPEPPVAAITGSVTTDTRLQKLPAKRKRKSLSNAENQDLTPCEKRLLKIEEAKLAIMRQQIELQRQEFAAKTAYRRKILELKTRSLQLDEKRLEIERDSLENLRS